MYHARSGWEMHTNCSHETLTEQSTSKTYYHTQINLKTDSNFQPHLKRGGDGGGVDSPWEIKNCK